MDCLVLEWERIKLFDEDLPAYLGRQLVDERA
jgi:hypothetical protein